MIPSRYDLFKKFEKNIYISTKGLPKICDYICGNLNKWTPNYHYWHNMYSYTLKAYIVCQWKEEKNRWIEGQLRDGGKQFVKIN